MESADSLNAPRTILARSGIGAAGHIVQRSNTESHRVVVDSPSLILVEEGLKRMRWRGGERTAAVGDALSVHAGEVVDIANTVGPSGAYRALWIVWSPELLLEAPRRVGSAVALHKRLGPEMRASFHRALRGLAGDVPERIATHRLREVLLWLAERGFYFPQPEQTSLSASVRRLLSRNPAEEPVMDAIAHSLAMSVPTLRRKLAAEDVSFRGLVHDVRMGHALALLQNTDASILQVAMDVGYDSASRFTARFRARFGFLPSDIRRRRA